MFEWQRHTQSQNETPHYQEILQFLDQRAQASEVLTSSSRKHNDFQTSRKPFNKSKSIHAYTANLDTSYGQYHCLLCKPEKHPLYACPKFKAYTHDKKTSVVKANNLCMNCLGKGHIATQCKSSHRCKKCQGHHHTLLHILKDDQSESVPPQETVSVNTAVEIKHNALLMTCLVRVDSPNGSSRALLDSGSSASFVSEKVAQSLKLNRSKQDITVSGIGDQPSQNLVRSVTTFKISPMTSQDKSIDIAALVVPRVTCDLPTSAIPFNSSWSHIKNLSLADPKFGTPGRIDLLLGVDIFTNVLLNGRRNGPPGSPTALETRLGWVLCGNIPIVQQSSVVTAYHSVIKTGDDLLRKFWQTEDSPKSSLNLSAEERTVVNRFKENHTRTLNGRFVVPLPKKHNDRIVLGESRSQAVRRFFALERSLNSRGRFDEVNKVVKEYFKLGHAEPVPQSDMDKPVDQVFYLPIHTVYKQSSSTTKIRAVFDASAKSTTGTSLNDLLLVGPTIHHPLI